MSSSMKFRHLLSEKYSLYNSVPTVKAQEDRYSRAEVMATSREQAKKQLDIYNQVVAGRDTMF